MVGNSFVEITEIINFVGTKTAGSKATPKTAAKEEKKSGKGDPKKDAKVCSLFCDLYLLISEQFWVSSSHHIWIITSYNQPEKRLASTGLNDNENISYCSLY